MKEGWLVKLKKYDWKWHQLSYNAYIVWCVYLHTYSFTHLFVFSMANLREIKGKIKSVKNLQKITRALEVVSTVKLQKLKQQAESLKDYLVDLIAILSQVGEKVDIFASNNVSSTNTGEKKKHLMIVLTSERGLCGALNSKLLRKIYQDEWFDDDKEYFVIGKKWLEYFKRAQATIVGSISIGDTFTEAELLPLYSYFDEAVETGKYASISLYFNYFKNSIAQIPTKVQLLPFTKESFESFLHDLEIDYSFEQVTGDKDMIIEPDLETYIQEMRRQVRNYIIDSALVQNKTGEHAARMIAMKSAKDNATEFTKSLTLSFNKARQWAITQEISEIVSAKIAIWW